MRRSLLSALVLALLPASGVFAADPIAVSTSVADERAVPLHDESGMDWGGFYAGVYGVGQASTPGNTQLGLGALAGVTAQFDLVLVGAEVAVHGLADAGAGSGAYGQLVGHAGLVVSDNAAVFAAAGYGLDLAPAGGQDILLGGGLDLAITDDVSLRAQYLHGFAIGGGDAEDQFTLGATFHF